MELKQKKK